MLLRVNQLEKINKLYSRKIKLPVGLGDWTVINPNVGHDETIEISMIETSIFDSFSSEDLKQVHLLHNKLADILAKHLSKDLDIKIDLHTVMATQIIYSDFINSMNENIFQADIQVPDLGNINLIFGANLGSMMIDRLVGGKGNVNEEKAFNTLEMELLSEQLKQIVPFFSDIWGESINLQNSKLSLYSGKYKPDNKISFRETYILFTVYLYFGDGELLRLIIAYPNQILRNTLTKYNKLPHKKDKTVQLKDETLSKILLPIKAQLGKTSLSIGSLSTLSKGDIVPLDSLLTDPIKLQIGSKVKLAAQPCIHNGKLSCQLLQGQESKVSVTIKNKQVSSNLNIKEEDNNLNLQVDKIEENNITTTSAVQLETDNVQDKLSSEDMVNYMPSELNEAASFESTDLVDKELSESIQTEESVDDSSYTSVDESEVLEVENRVENDDEEVAIEADIQEDETQQLDSNEELTQEPENNLNETAEELEETQDEFDEVTDELEETTEELEETQDEFDEVTDELEEKSEELDDDFEELTDDEVTETDNANENIVSSEDLVDFLPGEISETGKKDKDE